MNLKADFTVEKVKSAFLMVIKITIDKVSE